MSSDPVCLIFSTFLLKTPIFNINKSNLINLIGSSDRITDLEFFVASISYAIKESGPHLNLSLLGNNTTNWYVIFVFICSTRLLKAILGLLELFQRSSSDMPKWEFMDKFLTARYQTLEFVFDIKGAKINFSTSGTGYVKKYMSP